MVFFGTNFEVVGSNLPKIESFFLQTRKLKSFLSCRQSEIYSTSHTTIPSNSGRWLFYDQSFKRVLKYDQLTHVNKNHMFH